MAKVEEEEALSLTDLIAMPSVGLLIGAIGWWLSREITEIKQSLKSKIDMDVCKEREERIEARLRAGDEAFKQILEVLKGQGNGVERLRQTVETMKLQSQESDRLIGEALLVLCQAVGGNGACERVEALLNKISESRLGGA